MVSKETMISGALEPLKTEFKYRVNLGADYGGEGPNPDDYRLGAR